MMCKNCGMENALPTDKECWHCGKPLFAEARGSVKPLTKYETAQLEAALVLIRRRDTDLAAKVLTCNGTNAGLALEIQAYIAANSPNDKLTRGEANPE